MNISYDGVTVSFKTESEELFLAEKSGTKPNTVCILDYDEYKQLRKKNPNKIIIQYQQEIFLRTITNIHVTEGVFGKTIVVISWTNEKHHHQIPGEDENDYNPYAHNLCLSKSHQQSRTTGDLYAEPSSDETLMLIAISKGMLDTLTNVAQGRSIDKIIRDLYQLYLNKHAEEVGPLHD